MDLFEDICNTYAFLAFVQLYPYFFLISIIADMLDDNAFIFIVVNEFLDVRCIEHRLVSHIIEFFNDLIAIFYVLFPTDIVVHFFNSNCLINQKDCSQKFINCKINFKSHTFG